MIYRYLVTTRARLSMQVFGFVRWSHHSYSELRCPRKGCHRIITQVYSRPDHKNGYTTQKKDYLGNKLTDPASLEVQERRWDTFETDFIVKLPKSNVGFDCTTTYFDRLSWRVNFTPSTESDTVVDLANKFFSNFFKHHGMKDSIVSDRCPKFTSKLWKCLMKLRSSTVCVMYFRL